MRAFYSRAPSSRIVAGIRFLQRNDRRAAIHLSKPVGLYKTEQAGCGRKRMIQTNRFRCHRRHRIASCATLLIFAPLLLAANGGAGKATHAAMPHSAVRASVPLPLPLRGLWGPDRDGVVDDCENKTGHDYKEFMTVTRDTVELWEEYGTPAKVRPRSANRYDVDLTVINSDALTWTQRATFTLSGNGRKLNVRIVEVSNGARIAGEEKQYGPMKIEELPKAGRQRSYLRCPDAKAISS